jgi:hypothetical protein
MSSTENLPLGMRAQFLQDQVDELRGQVAKLEAIALVLYECIQENPPRSFIMGKLHREVEKLKQE